MLAATRYPVLYMHDGQNLFDPRIANTGVDWGVDEAVVRLADRGIIPPIIVVGVWSTAARGPEYSPWHGAPDYARFLIEELMPRVNREFRTLTGPANTAVMGSSMGGLLSYYLVTHHPDVFGACGCVSTHFPLSEAVVAQVFPGIARTGTPDTTPYVIRDIGSGLRVPRGARYWFDYGTPGARLRLRPHPRGGARLAARAGPGRGPGLRGPPLRGRHAQRSLLARAARGSADVPVRAKAAAR